MLSQIGYVHSEEGITLCRCYGTGGRITLPDCIDGRPVTGLADHCFAGSPSSGAAFRNAYTAVPDASGLVWTQAFLEEKKDPSAPSEPAVCTGTLEEIRLPAFLKRIGDYAFYGCRRLQRIYFPPGLETLGRGVFVAAGDVRELWFEQGEDGPRADGEAGEEAGAGAFWLKVPRCMKDVLGEIYYGTEAFLTVNGRLDTSLYFPGYYEDSVENTPARIIEVKYRGTGYKYRQCFRGRLLDIRQYDRLLYETAEWEEDDVIAKLCLARLCRPVGLSKEAGELYRAALAKAGKAAAELIFKEERTQQLQLLCRQGDLSQELLDIFMDRAAAARDAEAMSLLMDYRKEHVSVRRARLTL